MVHNIFALLQLLEYDRQESSRYIYYNALKNSKCARWSFSPNKNVTRKQRVKIASNR